MALVGSRLGMMLVILGLLAMVQQSTQLSLNNPLLDFIDRINLQHPGSIGLVLSTSSNEKSLNESNAFVASSSTPYVDVSGIFSFLHLLLSLFLSYYTFNGKT